MRLNILLVIYVLLSVSMPVGAEDLSKQMKVDAQKVEQATHDISMLKDSLAELRRDELNYKIEKNLLKESYNSSLEAVNKALTFILGLLAVLGFLGIRDIGSLKKEYSDHLDKLRELKQKIESDFSKVIIEQNNVKEELLTILQTNKRQDNQIKVMEIQERVATLWKNRNWTRAFEYIAIGLEIAPEDYRLLNSKALCLGKFGNYSEAIHIYWKLLNNYPNHPDIADSIVNLAEMLLITGNLTEYEKLKATYKAQLSTLDEGFVLVFLDSLSALTSSDVDGIKTILKSSVKSDLSLTKNKWIPGWDFGDVDRVVAKSTNEDAKRCFMLGVRFLSGEISGQQLLTDLG